MTRVLIVDDHAVVREGLTALLGSTPDIEVAATAADGADAVASAAATPVDVVLMDLSMPNVDGIEATRRMIAADPSTKIVVLTTFADQAKILEALNSGAIGYILKDASPEEIVNAVRSAVAGGAPLHPNAARVLLDARRAAAPARDLSAREREVLELLATGLPNKQIARRLGISDATVKAHLTRIFQQIGVTDRTQAALWAREHLS